MWVKPQPFGDLAAQFLEMIILVEHDTDDLHSSRHRSRSMILPRVQAYLLKERNIKLLRHGRADHHREVSRRKAK